ncbi:MAG: SdiA-regulated domain-containing protein [Daejeonella sp.]|uniref:SdiA-regulated domain-containing protein n=1 Tax=Daejeonella sp. JGW-45 TaxID=3034148 RepID=UPI0023EC25BA|nr:SdiA-regulated domain-containing protein [Daejeonella sp. JGW-45]
MAIIRTILFIILLTSCNNPFADPNSAKINQNEKLVKSAKKDIHELPLELAEISGITFLNDSVLVAIQDERGMLYYYNIAQGKIIKKQSFAGQGDYEDLVKVGNDVYVINSEGIISQIKDFESSNPVLKTFTTPLGKDNDIEGLGYDSKTNRLLIAPKEYGITKDKTSKHIYGFDLATMTFQKKPVYTLKLSEIEKQFEGDALEESSKKFLKALGNENMNKVFRSSAITVNEKVGDIYILSSINGLIVILSPEGTIKRIIQLNGPEYKQPEGMAFSPNGKLYVSNEGGKSGIGNILEIIHEK